MICCNGLLTYFKNNKSTCYINCNLKCLAREYGLLLNEIKHLIREQNILKQINKSQHSNKSDLSSTHFTFANHTLHQTFKDVKKRISY